MSVSFYLSFATSEDTHFSHNLSAIQIMEIHNEQFSCLYEFVPAHATEAYRGRRDIAPVILKFGTRCERSSSLLAHLIHRNEPRYPKNKRMGGYQSCYGRFRKSYKFCFLRRNSNPWPSRPYISRYTGYAIPAAFNPNNGTSHLFSIDPT